MKACKPVPVAKGAFVFCRYSLAILLWIALALQSKELVIITAFILALSALLTVGRAPMILLYTWTVNRLWPSPIEYLDEHAMRFAHSLGAGLLAVNILLLYFKPLEIAGWIFLIVMALVKSAGALGFCAAGRLYTCAVGSGGKCCSFLVRQNQEMPKHCLEADASRAPAEEQSP